MSYCKLFLLFGVWLAGCVAGQGASTPTSSPAVTPTAVTGTESTQPVDDEIVLLAAEFRELRSVSGHFDGGEWNDEVDQWMGRKHTLMLELGSRLSAGDYGRDDLVQLLGPPDHVVDEGDPLSDLIGSLPGYETAFPGPAQFLVYEWRGTHDFLFFTSQNDRITASEWWYAQE